MTISPVGVDIAKSLSHVHDVGSDCVCAEITMETCASSHYWARVTSS